MYPIIKNISDVLPAIEGRKEFIVVEKDDYVYVDYVYVEGDSFDDPIRRECRGLIFAKDDGRILRRPLEKFENYGQSFSQDNCDFEMDHIVTDKRDGSMIAPFMSNGKVRFGTRAGITEHSEKAEKHLTEKLHRALETLLANTDFTAIFEWTSPENRIVLDYSEDEIRLLRIRHIQTGVYLNREMIKDWSEVMGVKLVDHFDGIKVSDEWITKQKAEGLGIEGFVVFWPHNSFSVKVKTDEYIQMHRAVSFFDRENMILPIILDNQYDDLLPALSLDRQERVKDYATEVWRQVTALESYINTHLNLVVIFPTRKEQALYIQQNVKRELWTVMFRWLDGKKVIDSLKETVLKHPEELISVRWNSFTAPSRDEEQFTMIKYNKGNNG